MREMRRTCWRCLDPKSQVTIHLSWFEVEVVVLSFEILVRSLTGVELARAARNYTHGPFAHSRDVGGLFQIPPSTHSLSLVSCFQIEWQLSGSLDQYV
jgi:hypothetical protein